MSPKMETVRKIELEHVIICMRDDGIVHVTFLPSTEITVDFQNELVENYKLITGNKKTRFIFEGGEFVSIGKEARENAIKIEEQSPCIASAVIVKNLGQKILADFYYMVNKPKLPFKVFWTFEKAIDWLKSLDLKEG